MVVRVMQMMVMNGDDQLRDDGKEFAFPKLPFHFDSNHSFTLFVCDHQAT